MFNLSGSEIVVILLLALVILGPDKLPDFLRRAGRTYAELKRMGNSFQSEMKSVLDEPMKEMRETADLLRTSASLPAEEREQPPTVATTTPAPPRPPTSLEASPPATTEEALIIDTLSGGAAATPRPDQAQDADAAATT